jgi:hypothetical protein
MEQQLMDLEQDMNNYQKVKELVLSKLVKEGLLEQDDADEFDDRCQVLVYKGSWFSKWFDNNVKVEKPEANKKGYFMRIIELKEKENEVDRLMRRTSGDYDE